MGDFDPAEENRILRFGNAMLRAALETTADELEEMIEERYRNTKSHPAMFRCYERDMTTVTMARAVLGEDARSEMPAEN